MSILKHVGAWRALALLTLLTLANPSRAELAMARTDPTPALHASAIFYMFVPGLFARGTWAERELDRVRLGRHSGLVDDYSEETQYILGTLNGVITAQYSQLADGPLDIEAVQMPYEAPAFRYVPVEGALESVGLSIEDLAPQTELPWLATALVDFFLNLYNYTLKTAMGLRELIHGSVAPKPLNLEGTAIPRVDSGGRRFDLSEPGPAFEKTEEKNLVLVAPVVRSTFKILLGLCLGILLYGFIRNM